MPVDSGRVILHLVVNSDLEEITPVAFNDRSGNLAVDGERKLSTTSVEVHCGIGDGEVIIASPAALVASSVSVSLDAHLVAPLASISRGIAKSFCQRKIRLGDIRCGGAGLWKWARSTTPCWDRGVGCGCWNIHSPTPYISIVTNCGYLVSPINPAAVRWEIRVIIPRNSGLGS